MSKALAYKPVLSFNGVNNTATATLSGNVSKLRMWIRPTTDTQHILYFDASAAKELTLSSGVFAYSGVETLTVTVLKGSIASARWFEVEIEFSSAITVTSITFGRTSTTFYNGLLADLQLYGTAAVYWKLADQAPNISNNVLVCLANVVNKPALVLDGATWMFKSGKEDSETHSGLPQIVNDNGNAYLYIDNTSNNYRQVLPAGVMPTGTGARTIEISFIKVINGILNFAFVSTHTGTETGSQLRIYFGVKSSTNCFIVRVNSTAGGNTQAMYWLLPTFIFGKEYTIRVVMPSAGQTQNIEAYVDGVAMTYFTVDFPTRTYNTIDSTYQMNDGGTIAPNQLITKIEVWSDTTKTTKIHCWENLNNFKNTVGSGDFTPSTAGFTAYMKVPENANNLGFDTVGRAIKNPIGSNFWNWTNTYFEFISKTLQFNEGAILMVIDGFDLDNQVNRVLVSGLDSAVTGISLGFNASKRLFGRYNNTLVEAPSSLSNSKQLITYWIESNRISLRINGVEIATIAKSGAIISATTVKTGINYLKTTSMYKGLIGGLEIVDQPIALAELVLRENRQKTRFGIA